MNKRPKHNNNRKKIFFFSHSHLQHSYGCQPVLVNKLPIYFNILYHFHSFMSLGLQTKSNVMLCRDTSLDSEKKKNKKNITLDKYGDQCMVMCVAFPI